jgi:hypothetical protein
MLTERFALPRSILIAGNASTSAGGIASIVSKEIYSQLPPERDHQEDGPTQDKYYGAYQGFPWAGGGSAIATQQSIYSSDRSDRKIKNQKSFHRNSSVCVRLECKVLGYHRPR